MYCFLWTWFHHLITYAVIVEQCTFPLLFCHHDQHGCSVINYLLSCPNWFSSVRKKIKISRSLIIRLIRRKKILEGEMDLFRFRQKLEPWPYSDPPTITPFTFERFDADKCRKWMARYWPVALVASGIYLLLIFGGQRMMKKRTGFGLRTLLALWNVMLATFSICGFLRTFPGKTDTDKRCYLNLKCYKKLF